MNKNLTWGIAVIAALAFGAIFLLGGSDVIKETIYITEESPKGALTGPNIPSHYLEWGGVAEFRTIQTMQTATTTLCYLSPEFNGTTTIQAIDVQINTGTSTASAITFAVSTSRFGTTSVTELLADVAVASGAQATISYSPTSQLNVLGPDEFIVVQTATPGVGGYTYAGTCHATYLSL